MNHFFFKILIIILIIMFTYIIFNNLFFTNLEGFDLSDISKISSEVNKIKTLTDSIPDKITNLGTTIKNETKTIMDEKIKPVYSDLEKTIDTKITKFGDTVKKQTNDIVDDKIKPVYTNLGNTIDTKITKFGDTVKKQTTDIVNESIKPVYQTIRGEIKTTIDTRMKEFGDTVKDTTTGIIKEKITGVFTQLGTIFNTGLIRPITDLFNGIGNIFIQIFNILGLVVSKIVSLPSCIMTYVLVEINSAIYNIYTYITPNWLENIFSTLYKYTFKIFVDYFTRILGIDASINRCYGFNISNEMGAINSQLTNINDSFKKNFGNLDFSKIKV